MDKEETKPLLHKSQTTDAPSTTSTGCSRPYLVEPILLLYCLGHYSFIALNTEYIYGRVEDSLAPYGGTYNLSYSKMLYKCIRKVIDERNN